MLPNFGTHFAGPSRKTRSASCCRALKPRKERFRQHGPVTHELGRLGSEHTRGNIRSLNLRVTGPRPLCPVLLKPEGTRHALKPCVFSYQTLGKMVNSLSIGVLKCLIIGLLWSAHARSIANFMDHSISVQDSAVVDARARRHQELYELRQQLENAVTDEEAECLAFIFAYMPARDLDDNQLTARYLLQQTRVALKARRASTWAQLVPWCVSMLLKFPLLTASGMASRIQNSWSTCHLLSFIHEAVTHIVST